MTGPAPVRVAGGASLDLLVLTCRARDCTEQWTPVPITNGGDGVVQLATEQCPACGSCAWEVTQVQVAGSPSRTTRAQTRGRCHRASRSGTGWPR